uniref:Uncharacterized protein n=1 Tax=Setaria viridis TaxID=4556 RepID=A0A4U6TFX3_SETVI|nr:hypothetical protein SEVIR_8G163400v2 [Setaria viridis]
MASRTCPAAAPPPTRRPRHPSAGSAASAPPSSSASPLGAPLRGARPPARTTRAPPRTPRVSLSTIPPASRRPPAVLRQGRRLLPERGGAPRHRQRVLDPGLLLGDGAAGLLLRPGQLAPGPGTGTTSPPSAGPADRRCGPSSPASGTSRRPPASRPASSLDRNPAAGASSSP